MIPLDAAKSFRCKARPVKQIDLVHLARRGTDLATVLKSFPQASFDRCWTLFDVAAIRRPGRVFLQAPARIHKIRMASGLSKSG